MKMVAAGLVLLRGTGDAWPGCGLFKVSVDLCALSVAGCARNTVQPEVNVAQPAAGATTVHSAARAHKYSEVVRYVQPKIHAPDPALLAPLAEPNCGFKRSDFKTVDPEEWGRLRLEYERSCYQDAERAARERLTLLQRAGKCEFEPVRGERSVKRASIQPRT
jgi:hypothetical protein